MTFVARRLLRVPLVIVVVAVVLALASSFAMEQYATFYIPGTPRCGVSTVGPFGAVTLLPCERSLAAAYRTPFLALMGDAALRSLVLLAGAALLALVVGTLLGVSAALMRRRAFASGGLVGALSLLAAIPSFFLAYFLQIAVIVFGATAEGGRLLPVFGFGYDEHIVLPLLSISVPAIAFTAQLVATRMQDVLDADFVTTANAKGLLPSWILRVHVLPHARPMILEAVGSGLRLSVASLPIVEYLFNWNGIGALGYQAVALRDTAAFVLCAVVLVTVFAVLSAVADLSRPRALYGAR